MKKDYRLLTDLEWKKVGQYFATHTARETADMFGLEYDNNLQKALTRSFPKGAGHGGARKNAGRGEKIENRFVAIQRATTVRIEIHDHERFHLAALEHQKKTGLRTGEQGFLQHLALLCEETGIIPDSKERFGVIVRVEKSDLKIAPVVGRKS